MAQGSRITIRTPRETDEAAFLAAVRGSRALHAGWVKPPSSPAAFQKALGRWTGTTHAAFFIWQGRSGLVGVVNISEIVRGAFQSAYLGYYAFVPFAGQGLMREGVRKVIAHAFTHLTLHRLEANIQPSNADSLRLAERLGFNCEGYSPRYLKIGGRWRDHERWTLLADNWR